MMISHLIQHSILDETGFGIYAINGTNYDLGEQTVVIDFTNKTVTDNVPVDWDAFVMAYGPKVLSEQQLGERVKPNYRVRSADCGGLRFSPLFDTMEWRGER